MKKQYEYYSNKITTLTVREMAEVAGVSEQLIRQYRNGLTYPRLPTAVILEQNFKIPCEYWIINQEKKGK